MTSQEIPQPWVTWLDPEAPEAAGLGKILLILVVLLASAVVGSCCSAGGTSLYFQPRLAEDLV